MIQLEHQYICSFNLADRADFILNEDFIEFLYVESAGNILPTFELSFILRDLSILRYLNQGNILYVSIGRTQISMIEIPLMILSDISKIDFTLGQKISITGTLYIPQYNMKDNTNVLFGNSKNIIEYIINNTNYFSFKSNIFSTFDTQSWIQPNISDMAFINDIWMHSYIDKNTFIACACDNNKFIMYDMRKKLNSDPDWIFSKKLASSESSNVITIGFEHIKNSFGESNLLLGYNDTNHILDINSLEYNNADYSLKNFTQIDSNKFNMLNSNTRFTQFKFINDNVHENYQNAYYQNIKNLILYSSVKTYVSFGGQFKRLNLLDSVMLNTFENKGRTYGINIVSRIAYQITNRKFITNVTLCRESVNDIDGDLL